MKNTVFLEFKRREDGNPSQEIYYWRDYQQREVDFVKQGLHVK